MEIESTSIWCKLFGHKDEDLGEHTRECSDDPEEEFVFHLDVKDVELRMRDGFGLGGKKEIQNTIWRNATKNIGIIFDGT